MREYYLLDETVTFLNHGSFGACPKPVFERYQAWQLELERQPVEFLGRRHDDLVRESLLALGDFVGTSGENLVFSPNATVGLNMVARSLDLKAGDQVLTTDHEYNALNQTWKFISQQTGCEIVVMPLPDRFDDPETVVETFWQGVTDQTKVIFLSHITSPTALILPVAGICQRARDAGILTVIDGAHVPGHIPLNLDELGADFYSGNLHKWLSAPKGVAFTYIKPEHHDMLDPLVISHGWGSATLFDQTAWQGTRDIAAYLSVPAAIAFQREHEWAKISQSCHELAIETMHRICEWTDATPLATDDFFAQMITAPLPDTIPALELQKKLYDQFRVEVPLTVHRDQTYARVSIQAYNSLHDTDALLAALQSLLG